MFEAPSIDYLALSPILVVFVGGLIGCLVEGFVGRDRRYAVQVPIALVSLIGAFLLLLLVSRDRIGQTAANLVSIDAPGLLMMGLVLIFALGGVLIMAERFGGSSPDAFTQAGSSTPGSRNEALATRLGATTTEIFPLTLLATTGMLVFPVANNLILMFIALEVLSLPLYVLAGLSRRRRLLSQEASLKYFLLGSFSSAFFLFGAVMLYGFAGSMQLDVIASAISTTVGRDGLLVSGMILLSVGLLFKVAVVPFHSWTPDVYQGSPTPVTGFMAACTKVAAFGAALRVYYVALEGARLEWQPILAALAALTMVVGAVMVATQTDIKRILAYSWVAHAGFVMVGVIALSEAGMSSTIFYLAAYGFMTIPAFGILALVRAEGSEASDIDQWRGMGQRSPWLAASVALLFLAYAGIPLTSGFTAKYAVFSAAVGAGYAWLVVVAVLASAITAYVYFKVIVVMYFGDKAPGTSVLRPSAFTTIAVGTGLLFTIGLGVLPAPVLELAQNATQFLR